MKLRRHSTVMELGLPVLAAIATATPAPMATIPVDVVPTKKPEGMPVLLSPQFKTTRIMRSTSIDK